MKEAATYGIIGYQAPEFNVEQWIDADGRKTEPIKLTNFEGLFKVVYCFQSWCPGCHSVGFPALQEITKSLESNGNLTFAAVQTVFEGHDTNTYEKILETQKQYNLKMPFGHDPGDATSNNRSKIMYNYRTGGTPWFIFIDQENKVVFNDFHLDVEKAIDFLHLI